MPKHEYTDNTYFKQNPSSKARPILFSGPMVRALIDGRKTQTRRIIKPQPAKMAVIGNGLWLGGILAGAGIGDQYKCPYGQPGDLLWVRENCWAHKDTGEIFAYCAVDETLYDDNKTVKKIPSIHMLREKNRLTLEITDVRVQRLREISEQDAEAEGVIPRWKDGSKIRHDGTGAVCREAFAELWTSINGAESWASNPWVWALSFRVHHKNVDSM